MPLVSGIYEITAQGNTFTVVLNGQKTVSNATGLIAVEVGS